MTEKVNESQLLDSGLSSKLEVLANPHLINSELRIRSNVSTIREVSNIILPRKVSSVNFIIDRTENEHTWSGINVPRLAS